MQACGLCSRAVPRSPSTQDDRYQSLDLDFVTSESLAAISPVMEKLGFERTGGRHFESPDHEYIVEFVTGPVAFGRDIASGHAQRETRVGMLLIVTPTQCVMDRLAAYFHWDDPQSLEQALLVATLQDVDLETIRRWARREEYLRKFERFLRDLEDRR